MLLSFTGVYVRLHIGLPTEWVNFESLSTKHKYYEPTYGCGHSRGRLVVQMAWIPLEMFGTNHGVLSDIPKWQEFGIFSFTIHHPYFRKCAYLAHWNVFFLLGCRPLIFRCIPKHNTWLWESKKLDIRVKTRPSWTTVTVAIAETTVGMTTHTFGWEVIRILSD